jgi:hypothetical protein
MLFGDASVVANKFNLISFWIMKVERPPLDSIVLLRFDSQSERLQPLAFGFVVVQSKAKPITRERDRQLLHRYLLPSGQLLI